MSCWCDSLFCFYLLTFVFVIKHHSQPAHDHLTTEVSLLAFVFLWFVLDSISSPAWFCLTQSVSVLESGETTEQMVGHYQSSPGTANTMLPSSLSLFLPLLHLTFITAVIVHTNICMLPSVCNLCQHKVSHYFQGETRGIPRPNSFPSSIIMRGSRTVIIFITI